MTTCPVPGEQQWILVLPLAFLHVTVGAAVGEEVTIRLHPLDAPAYPMVSLTMAPSRLHVTLDEAFRAALAERDEVLSAERARARREHEVAYNVGRMDHLLAPKARRNALAARGEAHVLLAHAEYVEGLARAYKRAVARPGDTHEPH